jgi:type III secretion system low calcium response chaperone LcrH/SycD
MDQATEGQHSFAQLSEEKIQELNALAYWLYQNQHYSESSHFFRLLVMVRPLEAKFWKGLGACLQIQKDYEEALYCYFCCSQQMAQNQADPYVYVQTADCYFALKQVDEGLKALEAAHFIAKNIQDERVLQHVAVMQQRWSKDHKNT